MVYSVLSGLIPIYFLPCLTSPLKFFSIPIQLFRIPGLPTFFCLRGLYICFFPSLKHLSPDPLSWYEGAIMDFFPSLDCEDLQLEKSATFPLMCWNGKIKKFTFTTQILEAILPFSRARWIFPSTFLFKSSLQHIWDVSTSDLFYDSMTFFLESI